MMEYYLSRSDRPNSAEVCSRQVICAANCIGKERDLRYKLPTLQSVCEGKSNVLQSMFLGVFDAVFNTDMIGKKRCQVCGSFELMIGVRVEI